MMGAMTPPPAAPRSLPVLAGSAALGVVAVIGWVWLPPLLDGLASGRVPAAVGHSQPQTLALGVLGTLLVYLLAATWFATPWFERRGVLPAAAGLAVHAGWMLLDEAVANWRTHPWVKVIPELIGLERYSTLVADLGTALISVILLLVGAALLLTRPRAEE
jgi:hypothetical protein